MRFKIDENLPAELAEISRGFGRDALTVLDGYPPYAVDSDIAGT